MGNFYHAENDYSTMILFRHRKFVFFFFVFLLSNGCVAQTRDSVPSSVPPIRFKGPDPLWQSVAGGLIYSATFFLLEGDHVLHHYDSYAGQEYGAGWTLGISSLSSALTVAIAGDITATRNGGSYLSTLTIGWIASTYTGMAANKIYSGTNPTVRFLITLIPSVGMLVLINQLYFDGKPQNSFRNSEQGIFENFTPILNPSFVGLIFHKTL